VGTNYPLLPLGEVTLNHDGIRVPVKEQDRKPGPYPYYGASGIVDHVDRYIFDGEYLLIAEDGENLRTRKTPVAFRATGKFWVNNHAHIVQGNDRALTRFLEYAVNWADISSYLTGSTMPKLTQGNMNRLPVVVPPLGVQKRIVEVIGTLDDKIELNRKMNETLEQMARAIFKSWFIDFDPVHAKRQGKKPFGMDDAIAALFPDSFEQSELGEIPKGWKAGSLKEVAGVLGGFAFKSSDFVERGHPVVKIKNISDTMTVDLFDVDYVSPEVAQRAASFILKDGDLLMAMTGATVGKFGLMVSSIGLPAVLNQRVALFKPKDQGIGYVLGALLSTDCYTQVVNRAEGSAQPNISADGIGASAIVVPPTELRSKYCQVCEPLVQLWMNNHKENLTLVQTRDILLPRLLSGELSFKEAN
jgi:type I restriction enzyme, S subunit